MAAQISLKVMLEASGIKPTTKQLKDLDAQIKKNTQDTKGWNKEINKTHRNLRGVASATGRANKDFGRMSQGMGGLVQAYATIAANVFALSSAFLVLRRAADLSSMTKSAEDFSNRFGVSVTEITRRMQEASGGALDFAEALPTINKAVSAGVGIEQMEKLTTAATKAAQTFGGSTTEALSRFISASQRGRVEIIQTLGVVIKTEQAYKDYGVSIGKTALELSAFDRQQAILNATIAESERVFAGIKIDPNPFQQFLTTMTDLKDVILTTMTDSITPFLNVINKSIPAALIIMGIILKSVLGKAFPLVATALDKATKAGILSSRAVTTAQIVAKNKRIAVLSQEAVQVKGLTQKQLVTKLGLIQEYHIQALSENKGFNAKILNDDGTVNAARLANLKAFWGRWAALNAKGKTLKGTEQVSTAAGTNIRNITAAIGVQSGVFKAATKDQANYSAAVGVSTNRLKEFGRTALDTFGRIRIGIASTKSALISGFAGTFRSAQMGLAGVKAAALSTAAAWRILVRDVVIGGKLITHTFLTMGKVVGRTVGLLAGVFAAVLGPLFTFFLYLGLAKIAWDYLQDRFNTSAKRVKELKEAFSSFGDSLQTITDRTKNYISNIDSGVNSNYRFIKSLEFIRGTIDSTLTSLKDFNLAFSKSFDGKSLKTTSEGIELINLNLMMLKETQEATSNPSISRLDPILDFVFDSSAEKFAKEQDKIANDAAREAIKMYNGELGVTKEIFDVLAQESAPKLAANFSSLNSLFKASGVADLNPAYAKLRLNIEGNEEAVEGMIAALKTGNEAAFALSIGKLSKVEDTAESFRILTEAIGGTEKILNALNAQIGASKALEDLSGRINNFVQGIDKLRAASVANKETVNFLLDAERALETLSKSAKVAGNLGRINKDIINGEDLQVLKQFFDIKPGDDIEKAIGKIQGQLEIFKAIINDSINASNELKIISLQLQVLKKEEASTDTRRLGAIRDSNKLLLERAKLERRIAINNIRASTQSLANLVATKQGNSDAANQLRSNLLVLEATLDVRNAEILAVENLKNVEREQLKIVNETLTSLKGVNNTETARLKILRKYSSSNTQDIKIREQIFKLEKENLGIEIVKLNVKKAALTFNKETFEQDKKLEAVYDAQLLKLQAQTFELERQALILKAGKLQTTGVDFTKEGMVVLAEIFYRSVRDRVRNLKPTLQTLGEGFAKAMNDTLEAGVDKLLEGHGFSGFRKALTEALKDGLRDAFGTALKNAIKNNVAGAIEAIKAARDKGKIEEVVVKVLSREEAAANNAAEKAANIAAIEHSEQMAANKTIPVINATLEKQLTEQGTTNTKLDTINQSIMNSCKNSAVEAAEAPIISIPTESKPEIIVENEVTVVENKAVATNLSKSAESLKRIPGAIKDLFQQLIGTTPVKPDMEGLKRTPELFGDLSQLFTDTASPTAQKPVEHPPALKTIATAMAVSNEKLEAGNIIAESIFTVAGSMEVLKTSSKANENILQQMLERLWSIDTKKQDIEVTSEPNVFNAAPTTIQNSTEPLPIMETIATAIKAGNQKIEEGNVATQSIPVMVGSMESVKISTENTNSILLKMLPYMQSMGTPTTLNTSPTTQNSPVPDPTVDIMGFIQALSPLNNIATATTASNQKLEEGNATAEKAIEANKMGFGSLAQTFISLLTGVGGGGEGGLKGAIVGIAGSAFSSYLGAKFPVGENALGTVTSGPQLSLIGEGKNEEAVVPLPNNREIPVQLMGNTGGDTINIEQKFDFRNADGNSIGQLRAESRNIEDRTFNRVFTEINKGGKYAKMVGRR